MILDKHAGIFAAGEGSRLQAAYPGVPKPLVPICGKPLIEWTVRLLTQAGVEHITVLLNTKSKAAREHLKKTFPAVKFVFIVKDTKSSYESFRLVAQTLSEESDKFVMSAVDSLYDPLDLREFMDYAGQTKFDAALGITDSIVDEKPLWADTDETAREMPEPSKYTALRQYLSDLVGGGKTVMSALIPQSVDVDDTDDIKLAEEFIAKHFERTTL